LLYRDFTVSCLVKKLGGT